MNEVVHGGQSVVCVGAFAVDDDNCNGVRV